MKIFGVSLEPTYYSTLLEKLYSLESQKIVFTPNPEILLHAKEDEYFKDILNKADIRTIDGIGIYIGLQIIDNNHGKLLNTLLLPFYIIRLFTSRKKLSQKYGDRICGSDLTEDFVKFSCEKNIHVAIIDLYNPTDKKKVASQKTFLSLLQKKFPKLQFDYYIYNPEEKEKIHNKIKNSNAQILFSTLGMKKQEQSVIEVMNEAKNIKIGLGIGSSFDYFIGFQKRSPKIWRQLGLEWLYRIFSGPNKLKRAKRLWNAVIIFPITVIRNKKK